MAEEEQESNEQQNSGDGGSGGSSFSQADVDRIVADRLSRERAKTSDYDDLKAKAKAFDELEESQKSEIQKANDAAAKAQAAADAAELRATRFEIAQAKGLTATQAKRLVGSTKAELEADADELLKDLGAKPADLKQGDRGSGQPADGDAWLRNRMRAARR